MQAELSRLGELTKAGTEQEQLVASDVGCLAHEGLADVVDAVLVEAEAVRLVVAFDQSLDIRAEILAELGEERLQLLLEEGAHGAGESACSASALFFFNLSATKKNFWKFRPSLPLGARYVSTCDGLRPCWRIEKER